ncbi:N-acetylmuramoyl-L-alanine amidase [Candidatus Soleaferrea massiliensis]|uniref:N-acetylmuramoyl-L-alanine amidase n=1 Tax=Candidatus Soleaferrea massiliensis TaxID=1470354 RepID=UPI000693241B|nr:N-acetylmuramoyl-L-alanine amidase [Candidatus Soleaferrea massiliensis]
MKKWVAFGSLAMLFVMLFTFMMHKVDTVSTQARLGIDGVHPKVVIDAGHGGYDGGASVGDIIEKNINLSVALKLRDILVINGFEVVMTRPTDDALDNMPDAAIRERKTTDMYKRMDIIKANPDAIFVSIHQNKFTDSAVTGAQVFYSPTMPESEELAGLIQNSFVNLQPDNKRVPKKAENNLYLLYNSPVPAVIVECGFLSNPTEAANLCDETYQTKIALVITNSLLQFLHQDGTEASQPAGGESASGSAAGAASVPETSAGASGAASDAVASDASGAVGTAGSADASGTGSVSADSAAETAGSASDAADPAAGTISGGSNMPAWYPF